MTAGAAAATGVGFMKMHWEPPVAERHPVLDQLGQHAGMADMAELAASASAWLVNMEIMKVFFSVAKRRIKRGIRKQQQVPFMTRKTKLILIIIVINKKSAGVFLVKQFAVCRTMRSMAWSASALRDRTVQDMRCPVDRVLVAALAENLLAGSAQEVAGRVAMGVVAGKTVTSGNRRMEEIVVNDCRMTALTLNGIDGCRRLCGLIGMPGGNCLMAGPAALFFRVNSCAGQIRMALRCDATALPGGIERPTGAKIKNRKADTCEHPAGLHFYTHPQ